MLEPPQPLEVFDAINSLNLHKASGYDNISSFFLRLGNEILAPILSVYFGVVFELGFFPQTFKTAKVVPIFKAGDEHLVRNYRFISLLSCLSKVLEKVIKNRFINFFEKHEIFYDFQYGFRTKRGVMNALLDVIIPIYNAIERNKFTALLLMDLRKAFDTVSHQILLQKLLHNGIRGSAYCLIESYHSNRQQFVSINNSASSLKSISIASILGPLPFLIYVNDLTNATFCQPRLFADDTCLALNNSSLNALEVKCNCELRRLHNWCNANELQINPEKSTIIIFPPKLNLSRPEVNFIYNTSSISLCDSAKYLGVTIDITLNFKPHIIALEKRVSRSVGILNKLRFLFPSSTLLLLYYALVHPYLVYGLPIWGNTFETYLSKLQTLQNKAIRIITNSNLRTPITPKYRNLKILKITELYTFEIAKLMHQHSKNSLPSCFSTFFTPLSDIHEKQTKSKTKSNFYLRKFSTRRCQRSLKYHGVKIWNSLSPKLRNQSFKSFKLT